MFILKNALSMLKMKIRACREEVYGFTINKKAIERNIYNAGCGEGYNAINMIVILSFHYIN